jgi:hypothetical protein
MIEDVIRRLTSIVATLLLTLGLFPILACMTGDALSQHENACCIAMHGNCGEMTKTGCCRTEVRTDENPQIAATSPSVEIHWTVAGPLPESLAHLPAVASTLLDTPADYSPPGLLAARTSVLRI